MIEFQKRESNNSGVKSNFQAFSSHVSRNMKYQGGTRNNSQNFQRQQSSLSSYQGTGQNNANNYLRRCFKCNRIGHIQKYCRSRNLNQQTGHSRNPESEVMLTNAEPQQEQEGSIKWLLDSGCSDHIVNTDKYFSSFINLENSINVKVGFSLKSKKKESEDDILQLAEENSRKNEPSEEEDLSDTCIEKNQNIDGVETKERPKPMSGVNQYLHNVETTDRVPPYHNEACQYETEYAQQRYEDLSLLETHEENYNDQDLEQQEPAYNNYDQEDNAASNFMNAEATQYPT
ncbi:hypothetical protein NQ314_015498 [Rhamnusium bicolor]|uniref:CCHC-type domain-containing protein n=1 Tax=Rhamnusium bicolor TaxID=1586634 RepID=A0AAV8WZB3_9CUCU|nr:hypothetical protein NQ314_015498 [Rhamnusium bicolor]